jgi:putative ABC transport system substrate-binding protein
MRRRDVIVLLGGAAAWPFMAHAQQGKLPVIGVLLTGNPAPEIFMKSFREALREEGYVDGQTTRLEVRSAEGRASLLPEKAAELVRLKVDIIVTSLTPAAQAAKSATGDIPIVMAPAGDPVATGLVASLARPGGNITGLSATSAELTGKILELIREVIPSARRIAVLANEVDPFSVPFLAQIGEGARKLGIETVPVMARPSAPLEPAFEAMTGQKAEAVLMQGSLQSKELFDLAIKHRLPAFASSAQVAKSGGLMTYSGSVAEMHREAARFVDKILKGRKPADLPVQMPAKYALVINLKTAQALGMTISPTLLARADEVIE